MQKEIGNKTKEETYPIRESATSNGASYKCTHCGDAIFWNTHHNVPTVALFFI